MGVYKHVCFYYILQALEENYMQLYDKLQLW